MASRKIYFNLSDKKDLAEIKNYCLRTQKLKILITRGWNHRKSKMKVMKIMIQIHLKILRNAKKILTVSRTIPVQVLMNVVKKDRNNMLLLETQK
jgi:hypothetical protein